MLVLAGVTINIVINGGLIGYAKDAKDKTLQAKNNEEEELSFAEYEMALATGKTTATTYGEYQLKKIGLEIGDYVNYDCYTGVASNKLTYSTIAAETGNLATQNGTAEPTVGGRRAAEEGEDVIQTFTVTKNPNWRVIGYENGRVLITTDEPIIADPLIIDDDSTVVSFGLKLIGKEGYANGEKVINKICEIYGNGEGAEKARSIKIEDINNLTGFNPNTYEGYNSKWKYRYNTDESEYIQYKGPTDTTWNETDEDLEITNFEYYNGKNWTTLEDGKNLTEEEKCEVELISNEYEYEFTDLSNFQQIRPIIFGKASSYKNFWIGSSMVQCNENRCVYGLASALNVRGMKDYCGLRTVFLYDSIGDDESTQINCMGVRPVVLLNSEAFSNNIIQKIDAPNQTEDQDCVGNGHIDTYGSGVCEVCHSNWYLESLVNMKR